MDRRSFIRTGILAAGGVPSAAAIAAQTGEAEKVRMKYRTLGKTGLRVSEISFGTFGWQDSPVLEAAIEGGINFVCTCIDYQSGAAERAIAPSVAKHRQQLVLSTGSNCNLLIDEKTLLANLDRSLKNLGTDYVDVLLAHMVETVEQARNPAIPKAFEKAAKAGKARHLAISTHGAQLEPVVGAALELGYFEVIQCRYNFMEYPQEMELFSKAAARNLGVIVFKIRAGARESEVKSLEAKGLSLDQARVRWALANPNVSSACVAFSNFSAVEGYIQAVGRKFSWRDRQILEEYRAAFDDRYCRFCGTCQKSCPSGVRVDEVMRYHMYFKYYGLQKEAIRRYASMPNSSKALACDRCPGPACESACPHGLPTRSNLLEAHEMLTV